MKLRLAYMVKVAGLAIARALTLAGKACYCADRMIGKTSSHLTRMAGAIRNAALDILADMKAYASDGWHLRQQLLTEDVLGRPLEASYLDAAYE